MMDPNGHDSTIKSELATIRTVVEQLAIAQAELHGVVRERASAKYDEYLRELKKYQGVKAKRSRMAKTSFVVVVILCLIITALVLPEGTFLTLEQYGEQTQIVYVEDTRTGYCFARTYGGGLARVKCSDIPCNLLKKIHTNDLVPYGYTVP